MKRLLLPLLAALALPTAVEANPFSGDFIFKTDLGEKYIVKKNTIEIYPHGYEEWLKRRSSVKSFNESFLTREKNNLKRQEEKAKNCRENKEYKSFGSNVKPSLCETLYIGSYSYKSSLKSVEKYKNEIIKEQNRINKISTFFKNNESPKVHWVQIRYIPIFENINKIKVIQEKRNINCFNPSLSLKAMSMYSGLSKPADELDYKICDKYAKF